REGLGHERTGAGEHSPPGGFDLLDELGEDRVVAGGRRRPNVERHTPGNLASLQPAGHVLDLLERVVGAAEADVLDLAPAGPADLAGSAVEINIGDRAGTARGQVIQRYLEGRRFGRHADDVTYLGRSRRGHGGEARFEVLDLRDPDVADDHR